MKYKSAFIEPSNSSFLGFVTENNETVNYGCEVGGTIQSVNVNGNTAFVIRKLDNGIDQVIVSLDNGNVIKSSRIG